MQVGHKEKAENNGDEAGDFGFSVTSDAVSKVIGDLVV